MIPATNRRGDFPAPAEFPHASFQALWRNRVGIRASRLPVDRAVQRADLEPVALVPPERADTEHVCRAWQRATAETGVPTAILSDHGAEPVSGIARFRQDHPQTRAWYDLKHKAAGLSSGDGKPTRLCPPNVMAHKM